MRKFFAYNSTLINMNAVALMNLEEEKNYIKIILHSGKEIELSVEDMHDFAKKMSNFLSTND